MAAANAMFAQMLDRDPYALEGMRIQELLYAARRFLRNSVFTKPPLARDTRGNLLELVPENGEVCRSL
jgi:hypothetical protein